MAHPAAAIAESRVNAWNLTNMFGISRATLSDDLVLTAASPGIQSLDPAAARDVTFPAEAEGLVFLIINRSNGAEDITVKNDAAATLGVVSEDEAALFVCDGTGWIMLLGAAATIQT